MDRRKLTAAQRSAIAKKAAAARWAKKAPARGRQMLRTLADLERFCRSVALAGNLPPEFYSQLNAMGSVDGLEIATARAMHVVQLGLEVGLQPAQALASISYRGDTPTLDGDAQLALVLASGKAVYVREERDDEGATCTTQRAGDPAPHTVRFTVADAIAAGLWGKAGPWTTHGPRMLRYKALSFCLRDKYPDVLKGLAHSTEEMVGEISKRRYDTDIAPHAPAQKLTGILQERMLGNTTTGKHGDKPNG